MSKTETKPNLGDELFKFGVGVILSQGKAIYDEKKTAVYNPAPDEELTEGRTFFQIEGSRYELST